MTTDAAHPTPTHRFADEAWDQFLELEPMWATVQGDERWDDRLDDPSPVGRAALMTRSEQASSGAAMWRSLMPVRCVIHSSEVSTICSRS